MANTENGTFLTVAEVADLMRVSKMTVYRLIHSEELPAPVWETIDWEQSGSLLD